MKDVYQRLKDRLDQMATGYPSTAKKVEMKILKRLFTEEEAELFIGLSPLPEEPEAAAQRLGQDPQVLARKMEDMARKGLLFRIKKGDTAKYAAIPFVVGIWELQVKNLDRELAQEFEEYFEDEFGRSIQQFKTPVMRTIPINRDLVAKWPVAPYEDVRQIIENQEVIAIAPCICRTQKNLIGQGCDKPLEACFMFGSHAHFYVDNQLGRYIDKEEALEIIRRNEEVGLVMQPFNAQRMGGMCSCCGDCCAILRSIKKHPRPADAVQSNYFAVVDREECIGCETCLERCQMEAIEMAEDKARVDVGRCIGCGLCVTTCPTEAMGLVKKPEEQQYQPPKSGVETYLRIAMERGKNPLPPK